VIAVRTPAEANELVRAVRAVAMNWEVLRAGPDNIEGRNALPSMEADEIAVRIVDGSTISASDPIAGFRLAPWVGEAGAPARFLLADADFGHRVYLDAPAPCLDPATVALFAEALSSELMGEAATAPLRYSDLIPWMAEVDEALPAPTGLPFGPGRFGDLGVLETSSACRTRRLFREWLDPHEQGALDELAKLHAVPQERLTTALFAHVLGAAAGETLLLDLALSGRAWPELANCPGRFASTLPFVHEAAGSPTLAETIERQRALWEEAPQWNERFDLDLRRRAAGLPAARYSIGFEAPASGPVAVEQCCDPRLAAALNLRVVGGSRPALLWQYDPGLIPPDSASMIAGRLRACIRAAAAAPTSPLPQRPISEFELELLKRPARPGAPAPTVCDRLLAHFTERPDAAALRSPSRSLTYGDLDAVSATIAARLEEASVEPGSLIAIELSDPIDRVAALVGVWRRGCAFLPLDPGWPSRRRQEVLRNADVGTVIDEAFLAQLRAGARAQRERKPLPSSLAYVIYTSGSTGVPKGVMVSHGNLASYVSGLERTIDLSEAAVAAAIGSFAADLTYTALFAGLARGMTIVCADWGEAISAGTLLNWLRQEQVDVLKTVPSLLRVLLAMDPAGDFLPRRALIMGGEVLPPGLVEALRQTSCSCALFNHYGPTETTIGVAAGELVDRRSRSHRVGPSVLGRAIEGHGDLSIVGPDGELQPVGAAGEIWVGGGAVSYGYLGDARRTAELFVPHADGGRRYRTGDRARYLPDGSIEFLGRADEQVKLNGFRIELGEIESCLFDAPGVTDAAAIVQDGADGEPGSIVVFYCAGEEVDEPGLLGACARRLPAYATPAALIRLDAIPRLASGKADRVSLRSRLQARPAGEIPRYDNGVTAIVAAELGAVLNRAPLAQGDDFFACGGNSILALRAVSKLRAIFKRALAPNLLFDHPDPRSAAAHIMASGERALPIIALPREEPLPLSHAQERVWLSSAVLPPASFAVPILLEIDGRLDERRLADSLERLVERHEILRSRIVEHDGVPALRIEKSPHPVLETLTVSSVTEDELDEMVRARVASPFDLARAPPIRFTLFRISESKFRLLILAHHVAIDAFSLPILVRDLSAFYASDQIDLPILPTQYADYAGYQREIAARAGATWWRDYLRDSHARVDFPRIGRETPIAASHSRLRRAIPAAHMAAFSQQLRKDKVTLHSGLLGLFTILMTGISQQSDLVIGIPVAGRTRPETENLVGLFFDLIPFRIGTDLRRPVSDLWSDVQAGLARVWSFGEGSFDAAATELRERADPLQPWFNTVFAFREETDLTRLETAFPGVRVHACRPDVIAQHYDLFFAVESGEEGARLVVDYDQAKIAPVLIECWADLFAKMVERAAEDPRQSGASLCRSGQTAPAAPSPAKAASALAAIEQAFARYSAEIAIEDADGRLSYGELDAIRRSMSARLRERGLTPGARVAVAMPRDRRLVAAMLAVWHAGLVYVPIDLRQPTARLRALLEAAAPEAVLTESGSDPAYEGFPTLAFEGPVAGPADNPITRSVLAYIMFTSGSTGAPKGVLVGWPQLDRFLQELAEHVKIAPASVTLAATSAAFDISLVEMLLPLTSGGVIRMASEDIWHGDEVADVLRGVTLAQATPSSWRLALPRLQGIRLDHLLVGGEAVDAALAGGLAALCRQLSCVYGPTEATVWASIGHPGPGGGALSPTPLGNPFAGSRFALRDAVGEATPHAGLPADLYIGGEQLAYGYWRSPAQTALRFSPDAEGAPGARLYQTGDIVLALPTGEVVFLGRAGGFIKLNGNRIEPGEIEHALAAHPAVAQAAVKVAGELPDRKYLAAFVTGEGSFFEDPAWPEMLRDHLASHLPTSLTPTWYERIDRLPLNANGKLDRGRLPEPKPRQESREASDPLEQIVADLFSQHLGRPVSVSDNLFLTGSSSLTLSRLAHALRRRFSRRLALSDLFANPTPRQVASLLRRDAEARTPALPPLERRSRSDRAPLSPYQAALWFAGRRRGSMGGAHNLSVVLEVAGDCDATRLKVAYQRLLDRHDQLRIAIVEEAGVPLQVAPDHVEADFEVVSETTDGPSKEALIDAWRNAPFDLAAPGPSRLRLLLGQDSALIVFVVHHIAADGWSWRPLLEDLEAFYFDHTPRTAPDFSYTDYAVWTQRDEVAAEFQRQRSYWVAQLAGAPALLTLPFAKSRPPTRSFRGAALPVAITEADVAKLEQTAQARGVTLFTLFATAYAWLLHEYTGESKITVGTAMANRRIPGTQTIVGNFANIVPLVFTFNSTIDTNDLIEQVARVVIGAMDNQEHPFGELVSSINLPRESAYPPLIQNFLVFHNTPRATQTFKGWSGRRLWLDYRHSEYDLDLGLTRGEHGLTGYLRFNTDLYDASQLKAAIARFKRLCLQLCQPELPEATGLCSNEPETVEMIF
jgi:amino acid adenylation domain-containing protein